tara:strand:- start:247 stop:1161 length:915 start_codon:yes stop_codon:yes gene_type:complete
MKRKSRILTEGEKKQIIQDKEKLIINSFTKTFNKIKRIDENEIPQTRLIVDNLSVDANGDFEAELTIMGIDSYIEGNLSDFKAVYSEPERQTYDYPGSPGGIEEVLYGDVKYNHLIFGDEFDSENEEEVIAKLSSMAPNMIEMVNQAISDEIDTKVRDGYFDTDEFLPSDPRDDMYESEETMGGRIPSEPYQANENSNNELISQVKNKFGLDDLIFRITVDKPEHEYRGGNGTLYVYAEKGEDSVEFEFNAEVDLDYEGAPEDLYIDDSSDDIKNYPEYVKFITQFITPEAYKELEENIDIEVT